MNTLFGVSEKNISGKRLLISMSGGKTSAFMTHEILKKFASLWEEIVVIFANTGQENEETLNFVNECDKNFGFKAVWVEAVVHQERIGTTHRIVNFENASRNGETFEDVIKKYGIPNSKYPHCTRELKLAPIHSYVKSIGWNDYATAIGIRSDEMRRVSKKETENNIVYPLIDWFPSDKQDVNDFWEDQNFSLNLMEHQGNCKWCWKKSFAKHAMLLQENPEIYDFPDVMENKWGNVGKERDPNGTYPRVFFRESRSVSMLKDHCHEIGVVKNKVHEYENSGCGESCELYPTLPLFV